MPDLPYSLEQQRRLLKSLGFGFVETPLPEATPPTPPRQGPRPPAGHQKAQDDLLEETLPPLDREKPLSPAKRKAELEKLAAEVSDCTLCALHLTRKHALAGQGATQPAVLFVLDTPGPEEDDAGRVFEGEIGTMFGDIIQAIKYQREQVFVTFAARCRPAGGRPARTEEIQSCAPYLRKQTEILRPPVIVCFGLEAVQSLLPGISGRGIQSIRGKWLDYRGIPLMPTFALSYIFRNRPRKKMVWQDLQEVMKRLEAKGAD